MKILDHSQILQKIKRMAIEIYERHAEEAFIYLAGINKNGLRLATILQAELNKLSPLKAEIIKISLSPANPLTQTIDLDVDTSKLKSKVIIIVDDVANTGRTIFYAFKPFMQIIPKKIEVAVLVDRTHKAFPVHVGFVGICLATTVKDNILVNLESENDWRVSLQ